MMKQFDRKIVLEDGSEYYGKGFGSEKSTITELVFHTGMVGYQEILSDPSYTYQMCIRDRSKDNRKWSGNQQT